MAPAGEKRPERTYEIQVCFSMHTFTRGDHEPPAEMIYQDSREERAFDFGRYRLSKRLPGIVRSLGNRTCYHTNHGNFFTIEPIDLEGSRQDYEIYFKASRASRRNWLNLYVQSAYVRNDAYGTARPKKRKIRFQVIAYNVLQGKTIKPGK